MLQELIQKLQKNYGLSLEQAKGSLSTVTGFMKEKFPVMKDTVEKMFVQEPKTSKGAFEENHATEPKKDEQSILDKISDMIPGQAGEKIENFVKGAAQKAEDVFDSVKEKAGDLFGGKKDEPK